mmetsp:Transcript_34305/g.71801  ORF Transcript_34305/g.71801 Transcript_34305/m.71801 type:complete len:434 (+) Transcript_34305:776-2077(+)
MGHPGEPRPEQGLPRRPRRHHRDGHLSLPPPHGTGVAALSLLCLPDMEVRVRVFDDHQHLFFQLLGVSRLWSAGDDNRADVRAGFVSDHQQHRDTPLHGLHDEGLVRDTPRHPAGRGPRGFLERAGKRSLREKDGKRRRRQRRRRRRLLRRRQRVLWHPQQRRRRRRRRRTKIHTLHGSISPPIRSRNSIGRRDIGKGIGCTDCRSPRQRTQTSIRCTGTPSLVVVVAVAVDITRFCTEEAHYYFFPCLPRSSLPVPILAPARQRPPRDHVLGHDRVHGTPHVGTNRGCKDRAEVRRHLLYSRERILLLAGSLQPTLPGNRFPNKGGTPGDFSLESQPPKPPRNIHGEHQQNGQRRRLVSIPKHNAADRRISRTPGQRAVRNCRRSGIGRQDGLRAPLVVVPRADTRFGIDIRNVPRNQQTGERRLRSERSRF